MAITTMNEETPGSISSTLDTINEDRKFQGRLGDGASADITGRLPTDPEELEDSVVGGHPAEEPPESTSDTEEASSEQSHFTYGSHAEAEAAALQTEQVVAQLSRELQEVQDLAFKTLQGGGQGRPSTEESFEDPAEFNKRRRREVLDEIEKIDLDLDNNGYIDKVAEIQAKADADILDHYQGVRDADERLQTEQRESIQTVIDQAEKAMKDAGLNASFESEDSVLFWALTQSVPRQENGAPLSVEEQIQWTINKTKTYKNQALETYKTEEVEESETTPGTLSSAIDAVTESRRI